MTQAAQKAGAQVLLVGIQVPPNYGGDYGAKFAALFGKVAAPQQGGAGALPAQGRGRRARRATLFQATASIRRRTGAAALLDNVWPELRKLLADAASMANQPFLVGRSGTVGGSRSSEATSVSGSPGASPSLLGESLRLAFSRSFSSFFFFLASSFWRFS
jgi:hypothetical protein